MEKGTKKNIGFIIVMAAVLLFVFPFFIPLAIIAAAFYFVIKVSKKSRDIDAEKENFYSHDNGEFLHHEDECINCGRNFEDEANDDCIFCSDENNYRSEPYEGTYEKDEGMRDDISFSQRVNSLGKSIGDFAKSAKRDYDSSELKPKVEKMSARLRAEFDMGTKDDTEEPFLYNGTYDDKKEEAEGLKVLLKAGIIEKDEYEDRMRELKSRR